LEWTVGNPPVGNRLQVCPRRIESDTERLPPARNGRVCDRMKRVELLVFGWAACG
jgi:hypothetical protein